MKSNPHLAVLVAIWAMLSSPIISFGAGSPDEKPNIVFIFMDDMGYGDVQVLNPERCKIPTPHMDQMAKEGMIFTDAHTSSSVCTPSRYSLMTGRYNWRTTKQGGVLNGFGKPLIPTDRMTVASLLKGQGYNTAMIGKWHIGMNFPKGKGLRNIDWKNGTLTSGPYDLGFDYFFGISGSLDMAPYIYIENNKFVGEATVMKEPHPKRRGPAEPDFEVMNVLDELTEKSVEFIQRQNSEQPFFAYLSLPSPHTPIVPTPKWQGKSGLGAYGDFMMQTDDFVGTIVQALDDAGFSKNTLLIVSSDNGCSYTQAGVAEMEAEGHFPSAHYRGYKSDIWEGGHRVPFIVKWPAEVKAGTTSDATICLTDFMATCAALTDAKLPANAAEDSVSFLPALEGKEIETSRKGIVHHTIKGHFAYREGKWKLVLSKGSGGFKHKAIKGSPKGQLYDLEADPAETTNLFDSNPEVVEHLVAQLQAYVDQGRSTDGPKVPNDTNKIQIWK
ncbi:MULTISPECIES: arylsulfatase [unclassified Lentimonas]|uniref:sulfatase family protein n=1 Tax=unclassified Lentimonas TaxID=2630993 RepID=UPI001320F1B1|nr:MULTISPECIES: arylsulfatase [unclassified Lentimonas]CAA6677541.1 Choline-sulfatase (EC [Lentimonas sp. CC4]CAA6684362.1 Choline-sulfatase (EC [Lentimonas sp. CC6]CAA7078119.1 Choline-sulfatase (EC [Lentimonas sp. CC4]CAA7172066.1 Choline-sulfatase (EC [Lentimonas sp. CC21]CAA7183122.1 Choline-sulfatase (EC [Lentimonas sp. CC8]